MHVEKFTELHNFFSLKKVRFMGMYPTNRFFVTASVQHTSPVGQPVLCRVVGRGLFGPYRNELWEKSPEHGQKVSCLERLLHQPAAQSTVFGTRKSQEEHVTSPIIVETCCSEQKFWLKAVCGALSYVIVIAAAGRLFNGTSGYSMGLTPCS